MDRFAIIRVGVGHTPDAVKLAPETKQAIEAGMADAWAAFRGLLGRINKGDMTSDDVFGTRDDLKNHHLCRVGAAVTAIDGLLKQQAIDLPPPSGKLSPVLLTTRGLEEMSNASLQRGCQS